MRCLVTGAAGFIGSTLTDRLLAEGHEVTGVDCFTPYYPRELKDANLEAARRNGKFRLVEADLRMCALDDVLEGAEVVYHLAGQAGVRASLGSMFPEYVEHNVLVTHRLLEAALRHRGISAFVYSSSASVYGSVPLPMREDGPTRPVSPYGVTKLAAEHLCTQYAKLGLPSMSLRFFNAFGPRQRPDMAFTRLAVALLAGREFPVYGTGEQERDFTAVEDIADIVLAAGKGPKPGMVINTGGGHRVSLNMSISIMENITGIRAKIRREPRVSGDMERTESDTTLLRKEYGFTPKIGLEEGLKKQVEWVKASLGALSKCT